MKIIYKELDKSFVIHEPPSLLRYAESIAEDISETEHEKECALSKDNFYMLRGIKMVHGFTMGTVSFEEFEKWKA